MTQLKIHGGNMVFHKRVAISVTLTAGTGGTATFSPASGTSYALNSLPVGTEIYKSTDTLYTLFDANGNDVGTITLAASSGYNVDVVTITRGGVKTTIDIIPIVLQEGDSITANFEENTMRIFFYNNSLGTFYNELTGQYISDGSYAAIPRADVLHFKPYSSTNGIIEIYKDGLWISVIDYTYSAGQQAYIFAESSGVLHTQSIDFAPGAGTTYAFPGLWNLPSGYQYLDGSTFALQNPPAPPCGLVDWQTAGLFGSDEIKTFFEQNYIYDPRFHGATISYYNAPSNWEFGYVLSDGSFTFGIMIGEVRYVVTDQRGNQNTENCRLIIPFKYMSGFMEAFPYDYMGQSSGLFTPRRDTNLSLNESFVYYTFSYGSTSELSQWMNQWQCSDECDLINKISALANGYYQNL